MTLTAMTRELNTAIGSCELTFSTRVIIDTELASQQHQQYQSALSSLGCKIVIVPTETGLADSVFIEDTAIVLDEIAILCRPGAASRLPEVSGVADALQRYRSLVSIEPPGTLDGGDVLRVGNIMYVGHSTRSNRSGIEQLRDIATDYGITVQPVEITKCLHLKSAASEVAPGTLLINPDWVGKSAFGDCELIEIDKKETHAANALRVGHGVIYPAAFPRTMDLLVARGINVIPVDLSELQKAEGAATCCSLIIETSWQK